MKVKELMKLIDKEENVIVTKEIKEWNHTLETFIYKGKAGKITEAALNQTAEIDSIMSYSEWDKPHETYVLMLLQK